MRHNFMRRMLSALLVWAMLLTMAGGALAAEGSHITVTPQDTVELIAGEAKPVYLDTVFQDSQGHALSYTLDDGNYGPHTKIVQEAGSNRWMLSFTQSEAGVYAPTVTAQCAGGDCATATLTFIVKPAASGSPSQYDYDETPAEKVRVYVTVSNDGVPIVGNDDNRTVLNHLEVEVPYFDLKAQGLEDYYRYGTENGRGPYVGETVVKRPTALHLYLYLLGVYYMNVSPEEIVEGSVQVLGAAGNRGVQNLYDRTAYKDDMLTLNITGSATSLYMQQFWGHDENLMYYRNHVYPLMSDGWGSTADYILLSDGDTIDLAMFSNWSFWQYGAFACFDQDAYTVAAGDSVVFQTLKYDTQAVAEGEEDQTKPITGLQINLYREDRRTVVRESLQPVGENSNTYTLDTTGLEPGVYYLLGVDPNHSTEDACYAPANARVVVKAQGQEQPNVGLREGVSPTAEAAIYLGQSYSVNLAEIFTCRQGELTYTVSYNGGEAVQTAAQFQYQPAAIGTEVLTFTATDGAESVTYTVTLTALEPVPTRKEGVSPTAEAQVLVNHAYLLTDLQAGSIFQGPNGEKLNYRNYYYQRSTDGGETWSEMQDFSEALFGWTTIQLTEEQPGDYQYRFRASMDGVHFSEDTWTLTLHVVEKGQWNTTFYLSKDYQGKSPILKVYPCLGVDENGVDIPDYEHPATFLYSNFTTELPEGEEAYDPAKGILKNGYQTFYATLEGGRYSYRAFGYNEATGEYDIALGGMCLSVPLEQNVDGGQSGGTEVYLRCQSFYTSSKKTDNTYFTQDEYHVKVDCPVQGCSLAMGQPYNKGNYAYYPVMLYAGGNACLYNLYGYPDIPGYIFTQNINRTYQPGTSAATGTVSINTAVELKATVPEDASFGLYFQWNNFNTTQVEPEGSAADWAERCDHNQDGTKTYTYMVSKGNGNYTWRLWDPTGEKVTCAGWVSAVRSDSEEFRFSFGENPAKETHLHDFSNLGTAVSTRDEADLMINLDPSGYRVIGEQQRVRVYRHWEIINSDAGNIMLEPDFHWTVLSGNATVTPVDGGNARENWADITTDGTSILAVNYDAIHVSPENHGSHGGLFPATNPERTGVVVVTDQPGGTADADVDFHMAVGAVTTRSMDWDYNYDTWFYNQADENPVLDFGVTATGEVQVAYALVTAGNDMQVSMTDWRAVSAQDGRYAVSLRELRTLGNGLGGTVILRMTDETGVSYRLVRAAEMTVTVANATNPGEPLMPGDQATLTFDGLYRAVNKISGIFNPTTFYLRYTAGEQEYSGKLGQYQRMDNSSITITIPEDLEFADGAQTTKYPFTNGYIFGSMYAAANPFAYLYGMTDTGVGTNFNAVTVNFYISHLADVSATISRKVFHDVRLVAEDIDGNPVEGAALVLTDPDGSELTMENGLFRNLDYGIYRYQITKAGYVVAHGSFTLGSADMPDKENVVTKRVTLQKAAEHAWDGVTVTQPKCDESGVYQIGTGAELAWFAQAVNGGQTAIGAALTSDVDLAGYCWPVIGQSSAYEGVLDGQGHVITNLYCSQSEQAVGLFGRLKGTIRNLGVTGSVTSVNQYVGGIAGYLYAGATVESCWNGAEISGTKWVGGIAGFQTGDTTTVIRNCYNRGNVTSSGQYAGGIAGGSAVASTTGLVDCCYNVGTVSATRYAGGICPVTNQTTANTRVTNCFYLDGCCSLTTSKAGQACSAEALRSAETLSALGAAFVADSQGVNHGYPVLAWQVPHPFAITKQPVSVTAQRNEAVRFTVETNRENVTYQWQFSNNGGQSWANSGAACAVTDTMTVTMLDYRDGQLYRCTVSDGETTLISNAAAMILAKPEVRIVSQPVSVTAQLGQDVTFQVKAEGKNLTYQWQFSNNGGQSWANSGAACAVTDTMTVTMLAYRDGQMYRCVVKSGATTVVSDAAAMRVAQPELRIVKQPTSVTAKSGEIAAFQVEATGENLTYQWYFSNNGGQSWGKSSGEGAQTATLQVAAMRYRSGQMYRCVVRSATSSVTTQAATLTVE